MPYSATTDMLTGSIPTPAYLDPAKYVADAQDEIDSKLGFVYVTPFDVSEDSAMERPARLLLKRISNFLATGRLLFAVASPSEDTELHAYAARLVSDALTSLDRIAAGEIVLEGAGRREVDTGPVTTPLIANKDPESNVDAFYDRVASPPSFPNPPAAYSPLRTLW